MTYTKTFRQSGPGFFAGNEESGNGISNAIVHHDVLAPLGALEDKLSRITSVKGGEENNAGLSSLNACRSQIRETITPRDNLQAHESLQSDREQEEYHSFGMS